MKRRILSLLLAAVLVIGAIPAVSAADTVPAETNDGSAVETAVASAAETAAETVEATAHAAAEITQPASEPALEPRTKSAPAPTAAAKYPEITSIAPTATGFKLSWSAFTGAAKYFVFIRKDNGGWKKLGESATTSYQHKNLTNNTTYTYTVRAVDKNNKFISSYYAKGYSAKWLQAPQLISCTGVEDGQRLTWKPVAGAEAYRVFIKSGSKWILAGTTDTTYCINSRVTSGKVYTYTVRCWDVDSGIPLSYYDTKGLSGTYIATPQITSFNAVKGGVTAAWDKVPGATYYTVYRKLSTGWKKLGTTNKLTYTDTGLRYSARYTYTVRCTNSKGAAVSGYSATGWSFTHLAPPALTSITYRDQNYTLKWSAQKTASYYRVYRKELGEKWTYLGKATRNTFTDTTTEKEGVYTYAVRTMDEKGNFLTYYDDSAKYYKMGIFAVGLNDSDVEPITNPRYTCAVSEAELRRMVATVASGWQGATEGDDNHLDILRFYNTYKPLAGNHSVQATDPWAASFASAVWIRAGLAPYIGAEYTCARFVDLAKQNDIWVETDSYLPKVGDAVVYNWSDTGIGECSSGANHMGIVTYVNGSDFIVTEGDTGTGYVGTHERVVNSQYIRGFIAPNYKQIARYLTLKAQYS